MTWSRRFRVNEYVRGSLWLLPLVGAILGALLGTGADGQGIGGPSASASGGGMP